MGWGRLIQLVIGDEPPPDWYLVIHPPTPDPKTLTNPCSEIPLYTVPRRVVFPMFDISSSMVDIPLTQIRERRFDLIERAQSLGRAQNQASEDEALLSMVEDFLEDLNI